MSEVEKGKLVHEVKVIMVDGPCRSLLTIERIPAYLLSEMWSIEGFEWKSDMI